MSIPTRVPSIAGLIDLHTESIRIHGGVEGAPDRGKLEASVARIHQLKSYSGNISVQRAAVAVSFAIVKIHHPAPDGNKRLGLIALNVTLGLNGLRLDATEREAEKIILDIASGDASEDEFVAWVDANAVERDI